MKSTIMKKNLENWTEQNVLPSSIHLVNNKLHPSIFKFVHAANTDCAAFSSDGSQRLQIKNWWILIRNRKKRKFFPYRISCCKSIAIRKSKNKGVKISGKKYSFPIDIATYSWMPSVKHYEEKSVSANALTQKSRFLLKVSDIKFTIHRF